MLQCYSDIFFSVRNVGMTVQKAQQSKNNDCGLPILQECIQNKL